MRLKGHNTSIMLIALSVIFAPALAQDNNEFVHFLDRLRIQEKQEHAELEVAILNASDEEYKAIIAERMQGAFDTPSSMKRLAVIVDITNELTPEQKQQVTLPRAQQASSTVPKGVVMLEKMLSNESSPLRASQSTHSEPAPSYANLEAVRQNNSPDLTRFFQKVEGDFNQSAYETMLADSTITDLYLSTINNLGTSFETFIATKGRVIPKQEVKKHHESFIREGMYQDVINHFEKHDTGTVTVWFKNPDHNEPYESTLKRVNETLKDYQDYTYDVIAEGSLGFEVVVHKEMMEKLSKDSNIDRITLYNFKNSQAVEFSSDNH